MCLVHVANIMVTEVVYLIKYTQSYLRKFRFVNEHG